MGVIQKNTLSKIKDRANNADRSKDAGFINDTTSSSIRFNDKGDLTIAASDTVQYKMKYSQGQATEISLQSNTITNRKNIRTDEIIINKHKLNPQLWEWSDMKELFGDPTSAIGNLTMCGTVLVKAWEPSLKKWVLIRRPVRTPLFSNILPIPDVPDDMNISDNITTEADAMQALRDKEL